MKSTRFSFARTAKLLSALLILSLTFGIMSCKQNDDDDDSSSAKPVKILAGDKLIADWDIGYDTLKITTENVKDGSTYTLEDIYVLKTSDSTGTIYGKYKVIYDWSKGVTEDPHDSNYTEIWGTWYPLNTAFIGKWYAVNYKNLDDSNLSYSGAYKLDGLSYTDSLDEAVKEFTIDNGYFAAYTDATK